MSGITGRVTRPITGTAIFRAAERITGEATDEGLRAVTAEAMRQTMSGIAFPTKD